jgi:hypothetical protein
LTTECFLGLFNDYFLLELHKMDYILEKAGSEVSTAFRYLGYAPMDGFCECGNNITVK